MEGNIHDEVKDEDMDDVRWEDPNAPTRAESEGGQCVGGIKGSSRDERMRLTKEELNLARALKSAAGRDIRIDPLSDMMYGQFAITALLEEEGPVDMDSLLDQIIQLQSVREEYRILESYQGGCQAMEQCITNHLPGFVLAFTYNADLGTHTLVLDYTTFDAAILSNAKKVDTWMAAMFYMSHAASPDFDAIRNGLNIFVECEGYEWKSKRMFNRDVYKKWSELAGSYPNHIASIKHYHTGMFIKLMVLEGEKLLPRRVYEKFEVSCQLDARLDEVVLVPNMEVASQVVVSSLKDSLHRRFENEAHFSLEEEA